MYSNNDEDLIAAAKSGNDEAFEKLYKQYRSIIYNYIFRFGIQSQEAVDLTQEVFIRVYENMYRYQNTNNTPV